MLDCTWSGVTCTADRKKVVGLDLGTNGVSGQIPRQFFQKLKDLEGKGFDTCSYIFSSTGIQLCVN